MTPVATRDWLDAGLGGKMAPNPRLCDVKEAEAMDQM
jgi:hypothetical protein